MDSPSFLIRNGGTDFLNRQKNIFDILSVMEKKTSLSVSENDEYAEIDDLEAKINKRKRTKRFRGKESLFKVPVDPPLRLQKARKIPFKRKKWIKYSLADVSDYELSNEGNTAAAFSFLKSIQDRKITKEKDDFNSKPEYCAHPFHNAKETPNKNEEVKKTIKSLFGSSKLIMPEYVVGQSKKIVKNVRKIVDVEKGKEIYLHHIHEHEDE